ncbi:MAG: ABC transporter ATP-binding protein, partial [Chloroflexi bacterium]|nr:ABC transporter ATP-binding protein [Chloroflexota bacterium]
LSFFDRYQHGELMSRLTNDIETLNMVLSMGIARIVADVITLVGVVVLMFAINVWLALVAMIILPLMLLFTASIARRTRAGFRDLQMQLGQLNALMEETITGQKVVQAFGQEKRVIQQFDVLNAKVRDTGTRAQILSLLVPPMMTVLANADIALIVGLGGWLALKGLVTVGAIAAFISYARRFSQPLRQIADLYNSVQAGLAGAERVFEILDEVPDVQDAPDAVPLENVRGEVEFDHVNFEYVPGVPVLKDVCLHAMPGQTIALVGPTGAGKTTIVNLLSRFYDVQSGAIRIDGRDIRTVTKDSLRRQLGIV